MYSKLFNMTNKNVIRSLFIRDTRRKLYSAIFIRFEDGAEIEIYLIKDFRIFYILNFRMFLFLCTVIKINKWMLYKLQCIY